MNKIIKKAAAAAALLFAVSTFSGCWASTPPNGMTTYKFKDMNMDFIQLSPPKEGDKIAIIDTDYGEIRCVLYEQYAPNTVGKFVENIENGKYDDMPIAAAAEDMYFLTGGEFTEKGGYTGRTSNTELVLNEYSVDLWPFKGSLLSFSDKDGYSDSRWLICHDDKISNTQAQIEELKAGALQKEDPVERSKMTALFDKFYEIGGTFGMAGMYTIFGQTYKGFDVVEKLCNLPVDENGKVTEEVMIKSVTVSEFKEGDEYEEVPATHPKTDEETSSGEESSESSSEVDRSDLFD